MNKYYLVEIGCPNCPNSRWVGYRACLLKLSREIKCSLTEFPNWCPLPNAPLASTDSRPDKPLGQLCSCGEKHDFDKCPHGPFKSGD